MTKKTMITAIGFVWASVTLAENFDMFTERHHRRNHPPETWQGPTPTPTPTPDVNATPTPDASPTPMVIVTPTPMASATPSANPSATPTSLGPVQPPPVGAFGGSLPGLTAAQTQRFLDGRAQFQNVQGITNADSANTGGSNGLGPLFNNQSCAGCHNQPLVDGVITVGGAAAFTETRECDDQGNCDLIRQCALVPFVQDVVPPNAIAVAHRKSIDLFGRGLIEAIPDATIMANVHRTPVDGVTGVAAVLTDEVTQFIFDSGLSPNHVGRFGWKAQHASLISFSGGAYIDELSVTNRLFGVDQPPHLPNGEALLIAAEPPPNTIDNLQDEPTDPTMPEDPINNPDDIDRFTIFMQLLGAPPTVPLTAQAQQGKALFTSINCVACHVPSMMTGFNPIPSLSLQIVPLFSDLCLHDMGLLNDGITQAAAGPNQMKTAPLWGLRARTPFLHDGRAATVRAAILLHDGEAKIIRDRFAALSESQKLALEAYLNSI